MKSIFRDNTVYSALKTLAIEAFKFTMASTESPVKDIMKSASVRADANLSDGQA